MTSRARRFAKTVPGVARLHGVLSTTARRELQDSRNLRRLLAFVLARDSNCVDVGAHEGAVLAEMVRLASDGRHVAFEPLPGFAERLRAQFPDVDVRDIALANRSGQASFVFVRNQPALSGLRERVYPRPPQRETITVDVQRLDDALPAGYVPTLVKIDVEGAEGEVLAGGMETIARHKPVVVFEHGKGAAPSYGTGPRDVHALLVDACGLRIFDLDGRGPFSADEFETIFEQGDRWNFVARA
jgi:FkbM family methyltransferase